MPQACPPGPVQFPSAQTTQHLQHPLTPGTTTHDPAALSHNFLHHSYTTLTPGPFPDPHPICHFPSFSINSSRDARNSLAGRQVAQKAYENPYPLRKDCFWSDIHEPTTSLASPEAHLCQRQLPQHLGLGPDTTTLHLFSLTLFCGLAPNPLGHKGKNDPCSGTSQARVSAPVCASFARLVNHHLTLLANF